MNILVWGHILKYFNEFELLSNFNGICVELRWLIATSLLRSRVLPGRLGDRFMQCHWLRWNLLCPVCSRHPIYLREHICQKCTGSPTPGLHVLVSLADLSRGLPGIFTERGITRLFPNDVMFTVEQVVDYIQRQLLSSQKYALAYYTSNMCYRVRETWWDHWMSKYQWKAYFNNYGGMSEIGFVVNSIGPLNAMAIFYTPYFQENREDALQEIREHLRRRYVLPITCTDLMLPNAPHLDVVFARSDIIMQRKDYENLVGLWLENRRICICSPPVREISDAAFQSHGG